MILLKSDWARFPTAKPDYKTTNDSFLNIVAKYAAMGVENCLFPLALIDQDLKGIDPHSEVLSDEYKIKIGLECRYNIWFYLREVVRIPPVAGPVPLKYKANRGNIAITWSFLNNIDIALIQPRQTGKSVSTDCLMVWVLFIGASNSMVNMITKDDSLRKANIERLKRIRDLLPQYLVPRHKDDSDNQVEVTAKAWQNTYRAGVAQNSESTANNLGRGLTAPITHIDEGPFINFIGITLPAALAAGNTAREEAKRYGRPHGNIFTTTAGKRDDRDGRFMYDMINGGAVWTEHFFDCKSQEELELMVRRNCTGRKVIINATFSHRQLGYTDKWLYETMAAANSYGDAANRDFFNVWTSGTQSSPLTPALNDIIRDSVKEVKYNFVSKDLYMLRWYLEEAELERAMHNDTFILGLDTSEAVGRDGIAGVILNTRDLSVVGAFNINETNLIRFSHFLAEIIVKYPNITLIPERKSTGQMIVDSLLLILPKYDIDPFRRIFNQIVENASERPDAYKELLKPISTRTMTFYDNNKKTFGFNTNSDTRAMLYGPVLQNAAKKAGHLVHDKELSSEIRGLVVKKGRIDHQATGHDDTVVAWLLGHWLATMGRNLAHYGIDTSMLMASVAIGNRTLTDEEIYENQMQRKYRVEVEETFDLLSEAKDQFTIARLEHKLTHLASMVVETDDDANSLDGLIQRASDARQARAMQANRTQHTASSAGAMNPWKRPAANSWSGRAVSGWR